MITLSVATSLALIALTCLAALTDIRERRIPNRLVLVIAAAACMTGFAAGGWEGLGLGAIHAMIALLLGMVLFRLGFVGGGDAKLYAAVALAIPLDRALGLLGWTSVGGLVLLIIMATGRKVSGEPVLAPTRSAWSVPYGVAIFIGLVGTQF